MGSFPSLTDLHVVPEGLLDLSSIKYNLPTTLRSLCISLDPAPLTCYCQPSSLVRLPSLTYLDLPQSISFRQLQDVIAPALSQLQTLRLYGITQCFVGPPMIIPVYMNALTSLHLSSYHQLLKLDTLHAPHLENLTVHGYVSGCSSLKHSPHVREIEFLHLSHRELSAMSAIPSLVASLRSLTWRSVEVIQPGALVASKLLASELEKFSNLTSLTMPCVGITDKIYHLPPLPRLQTLILPPATVWVPVALSKFYPSLTSVYPTWTRCASNGLPHHQ